MEVMDAIKKRRSVRSYLDKPVEDDKLKRVLEAGRLAPSASNRQEWRFIVVKDKEKIKKLSVAANEQTWIAEAPVVLACCAQTDGHVMTCGQPCYPIDVAISIDHITLKAVDEGLGTCWIGAFKEDIAKEILEIPDEIRIVELLPIGYPKGEKGPSSRKSFGEIVMYDKWGGR